MTSADDLMGTWRLVDLLRSTPDGRLLDRPLGNGPRGVLIYAPGGMVSVHMAAADREPLSDRDLRRAGAAERALAYATYIGYVGRYDLRGGTVVHTVETASIPNDAGTRKVRHVQLDGDTLVLRAPVTVSADGPFVTAVWWTRAR